MQATNIFYAAGLALLVAGCNSVDFKKTKGGMPYKLITKGGTQVKNGDILKVNFTQKLNDSVLQTSYGKAPAYIPVNGMSNPYDISEVLPLLHKGDSLYAVQLIDTFMKRSPQPMPPMFKKGDKIITTIRVEEIFTSPAAAQADEAKTRELAMANEMKSREAAYTNDPKIKAQLQKDDQTLGAYLSKNGIQAQKTGFGTYVQVVSQGTGPKVEKGKYVSLKYKGQTLAGKVFDTNMDTTFRHTEPLGFVVGRGEMLKGFDEGVLTLKKGDKARLFIPSSLAYGVQSPSPAIGANENLVFDVEVLDVLDKAPQQPGMDPRQSGAPR